MQVPLGRRFCLRTLTLGLFMLGCSEQTAEQRETELLEQAWNTKTNVAPTAELPVTKPASNIIKSDQEIDVVFDYATISPLMQSYFSDPKSVSQLTEGLRYESQPLSSPVIVRVRWMQDELNLGVGEVAIVYDRPVSTIESTQVVANALLRYRNFVGGSFDMRLLSFSMFIEGQGREGCRIPLLNKSGLAQALLSPCLTLDGEKVCLNKDGTFPIALKEGLQKCFIE